MQALLGADMQHGCMRVMAPRLGRLRVLSSTLPREIPANVDIVIIVWALAGRPTLAAGSLAVLLQKPRKEAADALSLAGGPGIVVRTSRDGTWRLAAAHRETLADE